MPKKILTKTNKYQIGGEVKQVGSAEDTFIKGLELDKEIVDALTYDDSDPMFVTVEVIRPETSGNKRHYSIEELRSIERQINEKRPNGYQGHLKTEERDFAAPDAVTQWLKATIIEKNGQPVLFAKGYVFANQTKFREYLRKSIALHKRVAVSVYGKADGIKNRLTGITEVINFKLESIDWARYMSEGMQGQIVPIIAKEQQEESTEEIMTFEEFIASLTLDDLETHREDLIQAVLDRTEVEVVEVKETETPTEAPVEEVVETPSEEVPAEEVKSEENPVFEEVKTSENAEVVQEMVQLQSENKALLDEYLELKLEKTFANSKVRKVMRPLVIAEMQGENKQAIDTAIEAVANSDENKEIIAEMLKTPSFNPIKDNHKVEAQEGGRKYTRLGAKKA